MSTPTRRSSRNVPRKDYRYSSGGLDVEDAATKEVKLLEEEEINEDDIVFEDDDDIDMEYAQEELETSDNEEPGRQTTHSLAAEPTKAPKFANLSKSPTPIAPSKGKRKSRKFKKPSDFGITQDEFDEIDEIFKMGCESEDQFLVENLEDAIAALGFETSNRELNEIIQTADPRLTGYIDPQLFMEIMAYKYHERVKESKSNLRADFDNRDEVEHAFGLFINNRTEPYFITIDDLRNASVQARDNATDEELQEMLRVASGNAYGSVNLDNFAKIMKRSGAIV
ncbi:hypothetical protein V1512DRAFT_266999 [Lipomyces arxii]|uniref:uncharacterized protein n=1 Tax=Lipomyces arxii TaxID=56418 RepID=UPI0034CE5F3E